MIIEIFGFLGVALIGFGLYLIHPPTAAITVGVIFFALSALTSFLQSANARNPELQSKKKE